MKKFRRLFAVMLCLTLMFTIFSACGGQRPEPEGGAEAATAQPTQKPEIPTQDEREAAVSKDRTVITLGSYGASFDESLIWEFNESQDEYLVEIIDYADEFPVDRDKALQKLILEIMSGKGPDIIDLYMFSISFENFARKGVLEDLYPWIDADEELSRDDFLESILSLCEVDGGLYSMMSGFSVKTMSCVSSVADELTGWTLEDFYPYSNLINGTNLIFFKNPELYDGKGELKYETLDGEDFLGQLCMTTLTSFVDYETCEAKFDSPEYVELLECCKNMQGGEATEKPKLNLTSIWDFFEIQEEEYAFGEEIKYIGFPGLGDGDSGGFVNNQWNFFAMNALSENKEAAWEVMRLFYTEEYQTKRSFTRFAFPANKNAFNARLEQAKERLFGTNELTGETFEITQRGHWDNYDYDPATDEEVEKVLELIDSIIGMQDYDPTIYDIVMEEAGAYFAGTATAEDTAKMVQSRVTLYLGEQS